MKKKKPKIKPLLLIGRREFVGFPLLGLAKVEAKVDTGAYTTALHCHSITEKVKDHKKHLCFKVLDPGHPAYVDREFCFENYEKRAIKNSFGDAEDRFIIKTFLKLGNRKVNTTISLTDRANMKYPVLIGRRFLKGKFIVDVAGVHLLDI